MSDSKVSGRPGRGPRTKPPEVRRAELLDAAEQVIVERGLGAVRLEDVTRRAGVAIGTLYLYFKSKDDVVVALRERFMERLVERQAAAVAAVPAGDWAGRLEAWIVEAVRSYVAEAELHDVLFDHTPVSARSSVRTGLSPANPQVRSLRQLIAERPETPPDAPDPGAAAELIYSAFFGATHAMLHHEDGDTERRASELISSLTDLARRYLRVS